MSSSKIPLSQFNPLSTNPFQTRDDVIAAVHSMFEPLLPAFSNGKARVQLDESASTWDRAACDLEGFARPLFGIAPLVAGGAQFNHWEVYRTGLANGTDPSHPEYWGRVVDKDQRHVEATALGYALLLVPEHIWEPLSETAKKNVTQWLLESRNTVHANNNHKFFRVIVDLGLENVGVSVDEAMTEEYLQDLESLYIADGWYRDGGDTGDTRRIDYYNPFAMHYYGLLYAVYRPRDTNRAQRFRERARQFASQYIHWFAATGANVPYGRSLIYRQAVVAFWGALALANEETLPWGVIKGLYLRNLRWWATQPIARRGDGLLTLGYAYPNQLIMERYSSTGSPWWAMKAFVPLCLPADHPFWTAEELPMPVRQPVYASPIAGMVFMHQPDHTTMLVSGPGTKHFMRFVPEKYNKFAYSSRYGFSIESDERAFKFGAFDSMLALSDDNVHYRVREKCETAALADSILYSQWRPWSDVNAETWLIPAGAWHIRVHHIVSPRALLTIEGGFAAPRTDFRADEAIVNGTDACVFSTVGDFSGIRDVSPSSGREARVNPPHGNTNLMFPRTLVPQLQGDVRADTPIVFACAVLAGQDGLRMKEIWVQPPSVPTVEELRELFEKNGVTVEITKDYVPEGR